MLAGGVLEGRFVLGGVVGSERDVCWKMMLIHAGRGDLG